MIIMVTGGRDFTDMSFIANALNHGFYSKDESYTSLTTAWKKLIKERQA